MAKADAWTIWRSLFKDGDQIIVITDDDEFVWGKLKSTQDQCILSHPRGKKATRLDWDQVRFAAHDGFPCAKLLGADGSLFVEQLDTTDVQRFIRESFGKERCDYCDTLVDPERGYVPTCQACFADPFRIEDFSATLFNAGMPWSEENDNWEFEETLVLQHKGGARGILCDLSTIYHFEAA